MRTKGAYSQELNFDETAGVYKITNLITNQVYIGQSQNIKRRIWNERCPSYTPSSCPKLKEAFKKYGKHNFKYEIIAEEENKEKRLRLESYYIDLYDSVNTGYNTRKGTKLEA